MQGFQHVALHQRQFDVGAVAATEARFVHFHLLTLQSGRYASNEYHRVGLANLAKQLGCGGRALAHKVELHHCHAALLHVVDLQSVLLTALEGVLTILVVYPLARFPLVYHGVAVNNHPRLVVCTERKRQTHVVVGRELTLISG